MNAIKYTVLHWQGNLPLWKSLLVSFMLGYLLMSLPMLASKEGFIPLWLGYGLYVAWLIWACVGMGRCSVRVFKNSPLPHLKVFSAIILLATIAFFVDNLFNAWTNILMK